MSVTGGTFLFLNTRKAEILQTLLATRLGCPVVFWTQHGISYTGEMLSGLVNCYSHTLV